MTNREWVTRPLFSAMHSHDQLQHVSDTALVHCHALSSYIIPCPTACEWLTALVFFCWHALSLISWPTVLCEWYCPFLCHAVSSHFIPQTACGWYCPCFALYTHYISWPTNSMWVTLPFFCIQSHNISSHDEQQVSDNALVFCHSFSSHYTSHDQQQHVSDAGLFSPL